MKTLCIAVISGCIASAAYAQSPAVSQGSGTHGPPSTPAPLYFVGERGPHHRTWLKVTAGTNELRQRVLSTNQAYVELATGMYRWTGNDWVETKEQIRIQRGGGASATEAAHQVLFPSDIYAGAVTLITPEGKRLLLRPVGLSYFDGSNSVLIAELTNCIGILTPTGNQIIYTNAFSDLAADVVYTFSKAGFEQDVILHERPPDPSEFGLNPGTTRLQVLTEFFSPPQPSVSPAILPAQAGLSLLDQDLSFGVMNVGRGRAFLLGTKATTGVLVAKQWTLLDRRQFLIEEVPCAALSRQLQSLPPASVQASARPARSFASTKLHLPARHLPVDSHQEMQMARIEAGRGLVLDYAILNSSQTGYTFRGDTTYYISGQVYLYGTNTFEGGAVLKFTNGASINLYPTMYLPVVNWLASEYRPVIFTCIDDNSVGETISGSTGNPTNYYADTALCIVAPGIDPVISNFRIAYAHQALAPSCGNYTFSCGQILNCERGVQSSPGGVRLRNALFANVPLVFSDLHSGGVDCQNVTFSSHTLLVQASDPYSSVAFTNCLFADVATNFTGPLGWVNAAYNGFFNSQEFGGNPATNAFYPFQQVAAGKYYLGDGTAFTNAGTTVIDTKLLGDLRRKTVHAPILFLNETSSVSRVFDVQAARDTGQPTLGYHYDPLDYIVDGYAFTNAIVRVTNGVAIASYTNCGVGICVHDNASIVSIGTPSNPNWFVRYSCVQEQAVGAASASYRAVLPRTTGACPPTGVYRFTKFAAPAGSGSHLYHAISAFSYGTVLVQDCEFWGGGALYFGGSTNTSAAVKNSLFYETPFDASLGSPNFSTTLSLSNNLFINIPSKIRVPQPAGAVWEAFNNAFDTCQIAPAASCTNGWNAYINCTNRINPPSPTDLVLSNALTYTAGVFGRFYQLNNSPLINAGSTTADQAGLFYYTVVTNLAAGVGIEETNSVVDIGYHYVAADSCGNPVNYLSPTIVVQPTNQTVTAGDTASFVVGATGDVPLTYQWYFDGNAISGATSSTYVKTNVQTTDAGGYFAVVHNPDGNALSLTAVLTVKEPPRIVQPLVNQSARQYESAAFAVGASGTPPLSYQWKRNGTVLEGKTNSSISIPSVQDQDAGTYEVKVANDVGTANSDALLIETKVILPIDWGYYCTINVLPADPTRQYDLFVSTDMRNGFQYKLYYCGGPGQTTFKCPIPLGDQAYQEAGLVVDSDGDGLPDGYEKWVSRTDPAKVYSQQKWDPTDTIPDDWRAEWGLKTQDNPYYQQSIDSATADPNENSMSNLQEMQYGSDPFRPYDYQRPAVSVSRSGNGNIQITRTTENMTFPLTVRYTVGGTAVYGLDYSLNPQPSSTYPFTITIPAGSASVDLRATALGGFDWGPGYPPMNIIIALVSYTFSRFPDESDPSTWPYVVDPHHARVTLNPSVTMTDAHDENMATITLSGSDVIGLNQAYDLYVSGNLSQPWRLYYCGSPGQTVFKCPIFPGGFVYYWFGAASDEDKDGLADGYETVVTKSNPVKFFSDGDGLPDWWKAECGLKSAADLTYNPSVDSATANPDSDSLQNSREYLNAEDPWRNAGESKRPEVSVALTSDGSGITFTRTGSTAGALAVKYTIGGSATYNTDYTLNPAPSPSTYPFTFTIPSGQASATLQVNPLGGAANKEIIVAALRFSYADAATPHDWTYVVSPGQSRATWGLRIVSQPIDQIVLVGDTVTFSVVATGRGTLQYQWTHDGTPIAGATGSSYTIANVDSPNDGVYAVTVSDTLSQVTSRPARLTTFGGLVPPRVVYIYGQRQDYQFKDGWTYWIDSTVELYGTTRLEGGAVVKLDKYYPSTLQIKGDLICDAKPYYPAILTSADDDAVGTWVPSSEDVPWPLQNGRAFLDLSGSRSNVISNLRICFADVGITAPAAGGDLDIWDCQFLGCNVGISNLPPSKVSRDLLHNVLFAGCGAGFWSSANALEIDAEHITADVDNFWIGAAVPFKMSLTNSIRLGALQSSGSILTEQNVITAPSISVFQNSGYGYFYLPAGSSYRQPGTTHISPRLQTEFRQKTTYAPIDLPAEMMVRGDLALFPQIQRFSGGAPDIGYWYDALDYTVADLDVVGGNVTVLPGTAVGVRNELEPDVNFWTIGGFLLEDAGSIVSHGTPTAPNVFAAVSLVQEMPATEFSWLAVEAGGPDLLAMGGVWLPGTVLFAPNPQSPIYSGPPNLDFRFSHFYLPTWSYHIQTGFENRLAPWGYPPLLGPGCSMQLSLRDCSFRGGTLGFGRSYFTSASGHFQWQNNLFEKVDIVLDPSSVGGGLYLDLSLQASNNLFRNIGMFILNPAVPSVDHWLMTDNLFDAVKLYQNIWQPLDFDYNAYWSSESLAPTGADMNGEHDQVLPAAPPYEAGPFGNYYLPNSTPLYGNGSTTPDNLGLYHYTTRVDQVKEGDEPPGHKANIGLHYVATTGPGSTVPRDTDSDGIPDYVENWHGDGNYSAHTDSETDWQNPNTDAMTDDPYSTVYDDADLDGDGMVGAVEKEWNTNPCLKDNPLCVTSFPESLQGVQEIPVNLPLTAIQDETGLQMMIVGTGTPGPNEALGAELTDQGPGAPKFVWNTAYDPYGDNVVFLQKSPLSEHRPVQGFLHKVTVNNEFQVTDPFRSFGDTLVLEARTIYPNGFYRISFFDPVGNPLTYTEGGQTREFSLEGQADQNGRIESSWNLSFPDSTIYTGDSVVATVKVAASSSGGPPDGCVPAAPCPPILWAKEAPWSQYDKFLTFIGSEKNQDRDDRLRYAMYTSVQGPLIDPWLSGYPYQLNPESQWYATWGWPSLPDVRIWTWVFTGALKQQILSRMAELEYRNLFYMGHGNTDRLVTAAPADNTDRIFQSDIAAALQNPQRIGTQSHGYRLVFLYACCTGRGNMCRAFGIPKGQWSVNYFAQRGLRARAFIGNDDPDGAFTGLSLPPVGNDDPGAIEKQRLSEFFTRWRSGQEDLDAILDSIKLKTSGTLVIQDGIDPLFNIKGATDLRRSSP